MMNWLDKFGVYLQTTGGSSHEAELNWLRRAVSHTEPSLKSSLTLDQIVEDIQNIGANRPVTRNFASGETVFPADVLIQMFPGHDVCLPTETLLDIRGSVELQRPRPGLVSPDLRCKVA